MKMKILKTGLIIAAVWAGIAAGGVANAGASGLLSIDTGHTISKVRTAVKKGDSYIVASSYEGTVLALKYDGTLLWKNELSGFMNRDLWCEDITGDGVDEILAANADSALYCLDGMGNPRWKFKANDAPMNAVAVIRYKGAPYVVCGGYDTNIYYLNAQGERVKTITSSSYSKEKPWGKPGGKRFPKDRSHIANFIRKVRGPDGKEALAVLGTLNSNSTTGSIYLFKPMADKPFHVVAKLPGGKPYGDFSVSDVNEDGVDEITIGSSGMIQNAAIVRIDLKDDDMRVFKPTNLHRKIEGFG